YCIIHQLLLRSCDTAELSGGDGGDCRRRAALALVAASIEGCQQLPAPALSPPDRDGGGPIRLPRPPARGAARRPCRIRGSRTYLPRIEAGGLQLASGGRSGRMPFRGGRTCLPRVGAGVGPAGSAAGGHTSPGSRSGGRIRGGRTYLPRIGGGFSLRAGLRKKMGVEVSREADAIPGFDDLFLAAPSHPAASHRPSTSCRAVPLVVIAGPPPLHKRRRRVVSVPPGRLYLA
ncbi:unnamed protein product, partial [Urochloa humidicola]